MKKLTKLLSATLLLALLVSAFAVFGAFAAEGETADTVGTVLYDMDTKTVSFKNHGGDYPSYPDAVKSTVDGQTVWTIDYSEVAAGGSANTSACFSTMSENWNVRVRDDAGYGSRAAAEKNTDFIVFDMDVATDTEFIDDIYFNLRMLKSGASKYNADMAASGSGASAYYPAIKRDADGKIVVSNGNGKNIVRPVVESDSKWTNITIVYDFTAEDANSAYVYFDGYYAGNINSMPATTAILYFARFQLVNGGKVTVDNASTSLANFTIKSFAANGTGLMYQDGVLGNKGVSLESIPQLKYCMEDTPATPDGYTVPKLADIQRGDEIIPVYDVDDLKTGLVNGDVVVAYRDLATISAYTVVKAVVDETTGEDVATVTFQDKNGVALGEEGALFATAPAVIVVPSSADWAIVVGGKITASGTQAVYDAETGLIQDYMYHNIGAKNVSEVYLYNDYVSYGRSGGGEGSTDSSSSGNQLSDKGGVTFYLNGYSFTNAAVKAHLINHQSGGNVVFKNGTVINKPSSSYNLVMLNAGYSGRVILDNCTIEAPSGVLFDHRGGAIIYHDCVVNTKGAMDNVKATGAAVTGVIVDGTTINGSTTGLINFAQTNKSGAGRYGSATLFALIRNTDITTNGVVVDGDIYANASAITGEAYTRNVVSHYVDVVDSSISTSSYAFISEVGTIPKEGENVLTVRTDINLYGSELNAAQVIYVNKSTANTALVDYAATVNVNDSNIGVSALTTGKTSAGIGADVTFNFTEGCKANVAPVGGSLINPTINTPAGTAWANTSLGGDAYGVILTSAYEAYTYQLGAEAPVEFLWSNAEGDAVNVNKLVTLAAVEGAYKYSWAQNGNAFTTVLERDFALSALLNLSLYTDFGLNVYIPVAEFDSETFDYAVVDAKGAAIAGEAVEIDGVAYYKFASRGIAAINTEDKAVTVNVTINGAYGDSFTDAVDYAVIDYLNAYVPSADEKENALVDAIINYIYAAYNYAFMDTAALEALLPETEYTIDTEDAKLGAIAGAEVAVKYGEKLVWALRAAPESVLTVTYSKLGVATTETFTVPANGIVEIPVAAADFLAGITVSCGTETAEINLQGYYGALTDEDAKKMVVAIYNYAKCAEEARVLDVTAEGLKDLLAAGGEVNLPNDVTASGENAEDKNVVNVAGSKVTLDGNIVLDMAGTGANWSGLWIDGANGTEITGNGGIVASEANKENAELCAIVIENAADADPITVTISGGNYSVASQAVYARGYNITVLITGGFFESTTADPYMNGVHAALNAKNNQGNKFVISGGTFVNFDLTDLATLSANLGGDAIEIAEGYTVVTETQANGDVWYSVVAA